MIETIDSFLSGAMSQGSFLLPFHKPSITTSVLNGVSGSEKQMVIGQCQKRAFMERSLNEGSV